MSHHARRPDKRRPGKTDLIARLHRGLRPKLDDAQLRDLGLVHIVNLDAIARGEGTPQLLWDYISSILTWSRAADLLQTGQLEMTEQLGVALALLERYRTTGCIAFTGPDYQAAKRGANVMDQLALITDRATAIEAADWSEAKVAAMQGAAP